ncbi:breast cancer type 2 susceptibility protein-like [Protopterus annectens]|uniref:breast cancer type 2 susceptibility protein-like n=1 Tax=Protopterus annectens TaxID=7888 RepID=UPI001CFB5CD1|nr:breast cancer type 2 susceptibility protein-like [Protopterus annectens]
MAMRDGRPSFTEIFKARCDTDLGPLSVNWFEELTLQTPAYRPKELEDQCHPANWSNENCFKTPWSKPPPCSQLLSTPAVFKDHSSRVPLDFTPEKDVSKNVSQLSHPVHEIALPSLTKTPVLKSKAFPAACSHASPNESPAILRDMCRTPHQVKNCGVFGGLFSTPKYPDTLTPIRIRESLGAETDPDMSWTSSLATPPSLTPTVIIAKENNCLPETSLPENRTAIVD